MVLNIGTPYVTPKKQKKKTYICKCLKCGGIVELNAYKVTHNNYQFCRNCTQKQEYFVESLVGNRYGRLVVKERAENKVQPNGSVKITWKCLCDCGNEVEVVGSHLKSGHTTSCGCYQRERASDENVKNLVGEVFGRLTVISPSYRKGRQYWNCLCECGNYKEASTSSLTIGRVKSCGCLNSVAEFEMEKYLQEKGYTYKKQYSFEDCKDKRKLPFDFALFSGEKLVMLIELNGQQHYYPFTFNGEDRDTKEKNFIDRQKKDKIKQDYCLSKGIPLLSIKYNLFYKQNEILEQFILKENLKL